MTLQRLSDIPIGESIFGLFYGGAGSGKTAACMTAGDDTLYCNVEKRLSTLQLKKMQDKYHFNPYVITVSEQPIPDGGAKALIELTNQINAAIKSDGDKFSKIIVDGSTALRRFGMNMALEVNQKSGKSKSLDKTSPIRAVVKDFPYSDIAVQDFGVEMRMTETFLIAMKEYCFDAKKHFFMTAHERIEYNKAAQIGGEATVRSIRPGFTGQSAPDDIPGLFDLVWHFETKGGGERTIYQARTEGDEMLIAKTCLGDFPTMVTNPNIQSIIKNIRGEK